VYINSLELFMQVYINSLLIFFDSQCYDEELSPIVQKKCAKKINQLYMNPLD